MSMARRTAAVALALVAGACGAISGPVGLPRPSPPTGALATWSSFPAHANPRPIIAFGDQVESIGPAGFPTDERKVAWNCNRFVFAPGVMLAVAPPAKALAGGGSYPAIAADRGFAELIKERSPGVDSACASLPPFLVTAVRWGMAGFPTDRGTMEMSAWLFDVPEVGAHLGYAAVDPSSFWGGGVIKQGRGARVSADGRTLRIGVPNAIPGPCGADYTASAAESDTAVAVAVLRQPHPALSGPVACALSLQISFISLRLRSPLGGRVLVDENGDAGAACPDNQGHC